MHFKFKDGNLFAKKWEKSKSVILVNLTLFVLLIVAEILAPGFNTPKHLDAVLRQAAFLGIICVGQTLVILTGGIDLSIAATITIANVIGAQVMDGSNGNVLTALLMCLLIGVIVGVANGFGISFLKIPALIMTLGVGTVMQGVALIYSKGAPKGYTAPIMDFLSNGRVGNISVVVLIWVVLSVIAIIVLKKTVFGRSVYSIGTNEIASKYSGVNVRLNIVIIYVISAVLASLTGLLLVGYTGTSYLDIGDPYNMNSISAVIVGGTSAMGGSGGYVGTISGVIIMTVLVNLLTILHMPEAGRLIVQGLVVVTLLIVVYRKKSSF